MRQIPGLMVLLLLVLPPAPVSAQQSEPLYKTPYRVINVHRHGSPPSAAAAQAELEVFDRVGMDVAVILDGRWTGNGLAEWLALRDKHRDRIALFANLNFELAKQPGFSEAIVKELVEQHRLGVQGIKFFKGFGMTARDGSGKLIAIDDPRLDAYFEKCGELGLPVLIHSADPREYWYPRTYNSDHYGRTDRAKHWEDPQMPKWEELIRQRNNLLAKHPKTIFIGAHFGSLTYDLQQLAETLDKYPNFYVESSARLRILGRLNPVAVRDFFVKYQDRILFGTDSSILGGADPKDAAAVQAWKDGAARFYSRHFQYFETSRSDLMEPYGYEGEWLRLAGAKLPAEVLEKFYHANAEKLIPGLKKN